MTRPIRIAALLLGLVSLGLPGSGACRRITAVAELADRSVVERALAAGEKGDPLESTAARAYDRFLSSEQRGFARRVHAALPSARVLTRLRVLLNAVTVELPPDDVAVLAALPGVARIVPTRRYRIALDVGPALVGATSLWTAAPPLGSRGDGASIAVIDSGIDPANPFFAVAGPAPPGFPRGDPSLTNGKVIVAKVFLDDPSATPRDQNGHGTSVASIAAGNEATLSPLGLLSGVAPGARLGSYRAFDRAGLGRNDLIARALEEAFLDGFRIANMSFGTTVRGGDDPVLLGAISRAVAGGMTIAVAAGNSGPRSRTIQSPGTSEDVITVAATSNAHRVGPVVRVTAPEPVDPSLVTLSAQPGRGSGALPEGTLPYRDVATIDGSRRACGTLPAGSLAGVAALIERGRCSFTRKVRRVTRAGALAAIVFDDRPTRGDVLLSMRLRGTTIAAVFVDRSAGLGLRGWLRSNPGARLEIAALGEVPARPDVVAEFSSRGPTATRLLKPDLAAPGEDVFAGTVTDVQAELGNPTGFEVAAGTSQAAAFVSGAVALLRELHPDWTPGQLKSALVTSADPASARSSAPGVLAYGSGRLDVARAAAVPFTVAPPTLSIRLPRGAGSVTQRVVLSGVGPDPVALVVSVARDARSRAIEIALSPERLVVEPGSAVGLDVIATRDRRRRGVATGALELSAADGSVLRVPFLVDGR